MQSSIKVIGLTGSIGSGKSAVSDIIKKAGIPVIDADVISKEAVAKGSKGLEMIARQFGDGFIDRDGNLDRKKLAGLVFENEDARKKLNGIVHPLVIEEFLRQKKLYEEQGREMVVFDCPLLLEQNLERLVDTVVVVHTSEDVQIERIMKRDAMTREEAVARIRSQMKSSEKLEKADIAIDNSYSLEKLNETVLDLIDNKFSKKD